MDLNGPTPDRIFHVFRVSNDFLFRFSRPRSSTRFRVCRSILLGLSHRCCQRGSRQRCTRAQSHHGRASRNFHSRRWFGFACPQLFREFSSYSQPAKHARNSHHFAHVQCVAVHIRLVQLRLARESGSNKAGAIVSLTHLRLSLLRPPRGYQGVLRDHRSAAESSNPSKMRFLHSPIRSASATSQECPTLRRAAAHAGP